jgi:hypothetical protein
MKLTVDNAAILAYRRLPYRTWFALAEFVDNSTDAYFRSDNRKDLDAALEVSGEILTVDITYDKDAGILRITDNSIGMSEEELIDALVVGKRPKVTAGRSEFGMGMKTAGIWFADEIEIRTKKLGAHEELKITIDVDAFAAGNADLPPVRTPKDSSHHYTVIELRGLRRKLGPVALKKTRDFLGSIYREDLRESKLRLIVNSQEVHSPFTGNDDEKFLKRSDGTPYKIPIANLVVNEKTVDGWIAVLGPGYAGRPKAGFTLMRHGRAVQSWLDSWRPEEIFGDARNDLLNQRITGELKMDGFTASHTKDAIDWDGDDEQILGEKLLDLCKKYDLIKQARRTTKSLENDEAMALEQAEAQARLNEEINNPKFTDAFTLTTVPKPAHAEVALEVLMTEASKNDPFLTYSLLDGRVAEIYELRLSVNDPYYEYEVQANLDLKIVLNSNHPGMSLLPTVEARLAHYHHVVLDALAEWRCAQQNEPLNSSSMRVMKDGLFRALGDLDAGD